MEKHPETFTKQNLCPLCYVTTSEEVESQEEAHTTHNICEFCSSIEHLSEKELQARLLKHQIEHLKGMLVRSHSEIQKRLYSVFMSEIEAIWNYILADED